VIRNFRDQGSEDIFNGANTKEARKCLPRELWSIACRKLDMLNAAARLEDMRAPPGNRLEKLTGVTYEARDVWRVRINDQFRVVFSFEGRDALHVTCADYH
jgi:proteic killer suppression protein